MSGTGDGKQVHFAESVRQIYLAFMDAHFRPADIDAMTLWQVAHLLKPSEQPLTTRVVAGRNDRAARDAAIARSAEVATASEIARREGRPIAPAGVNASDPRIAAALAEARGKQGQA